MAKVTKETLIGELMQLEPRAAAILFASGMHCVGCPSSSGESLEEAAFVHGMDCKELVDRINEYLEKLEQAQA